MTTNDEKELNASNWEEHYPIPPVERVSDKTRPTVDEKELRERLAAIEHERWADWQKWLHGKLKNHFIQGDDGSLIGTGHKIMNEKDFEHWERQINTPYSELSDKEKASDMEQVDRYWDLLLAWRDREVVKERNLAHREGYVSGVYAFSNYYMDASIPALRQPIMPHIARELVDGYVNHWEATLKDEQLNKEEK